MTIEVAHLLILAPWLSSKPCSFDGGSGPNRLYMRETDGVWRLQPCSFTNMGAGNGRLPVLLIEKGGFKVPDDCS